LPKKDESIIRDTSPTKKVKAKTRKEKIGFKEKNLKKA